MHFIDGKVKMEIISGDFQGNVTDSVTSNQAETSSHHTELGKWWQVTYEVKVFTGEVTEVRQNECKVLVIMVPASSENGQRKRMKSITNYPALLVLLLLQIQEDT